jgi:hypothetical protein
LRAREKVKFSEHFFILYEKLGLCNNNNNNNALKMFKISEVKLNNIINTSIIYVFMATNEQKNSKSAFY